MTHHYGGTRKHTTVLDATTWSLFLHDMQDGLLYSPESDLNNVKVVHSRGGGLYSFDLTLPPLSSSSAAHIGHIRGGVHLLTIRLFMNAHGQLDALQGETPTCSKPTPIYSVNGLEQAVVKVMEIAHSTFVRGAFPMDNANLKHLQNTPYSILMAIIILRMSVGKCLFFVSENQVGSSFSNMAIGFSGQGPALCQGTVGACYWLHEFAPSCCWEEALAL